MILKDLVLVELARLNGEMVSLGMRIMDGSASAVEQQDYVERLIATGERLRRRANEKDHTVVEGTWGHIACVA